MFAGRMRPTSIVTLLRHLSNCCHPHEYVVTVLRLDCTPDAYVSFGLSTTDINFLALLVALDGS